MPETHYAKTWPAYFDAVASGRKPFELRRDDRGYEEGDTLVLLEWEPETFVALVGDGADPDGEVANAAAYTGRWVERRITYALRGGPWLQPGFVALGLGGPLMDLRDTLGTVADCEANCINCRDLARLALEGRFGDDD